MSFQIPDVRPIYLQNLPYFRTGNENNITPKP